MIPEKYLTSLIARAFEEDLGDGDHSTLSCIDKSEQGKAKLLVKQDGIIAGVEVAKAVCNYLSKDLKLNIFIQDGTPIKKGDIVFELSGPQHDILRAERTILNFMQRMSGIATVTAEYVKELQGLHTKVLDTRKTTPGLRLIEKEAVKMVCRYAKGAGMLDRVEVLGFCDGGRSVDWITECGGSVINLLTLLQMVALSP